MGCAGLPDSCSSCVCINFYERIGEESSLLDVDPITKEVKVSNGPKRKLNNFTYA